MNNDNLIIKFLIKISRLGVDRIYGNQLKEIVALSNVISMITICTMWFLAIIFYVIEISPAVWICLIASLFSLLFLIFNHLDYHRIIKPISIICHAILIYIADQLFGTALDVSNFYMPLTLSLFGFYSFRQKKMILMLSLIIISLFLFGKFESNLLFDKYSYDLSNNKILDVIFYITVFFFNLVFIYLLAKTNFKINAKLSQANELIRQVQHIAGVSNINYNISKQKWEFPKEDFEILFKNKLMLSENSYQEFVNHLHPEDASIFRDLIKDIINNHKELDIEFRLFNNSGEIIWLEAMSKFIKVDANDEIQYLVTLHDITDRKLKEQKLKDQSTELTQANMKKDKFISIIAHDLKGSISGFVGLTSQMVQFNSEMSNEEILEYTKILNDSSKNLYGLLENLLHWSRMQKSEMEFNANVYNLADIIRESSANYNANIFEKNINFQLELEENIPVYVDKNMMDLVFRNLITNAIKFTPEHGIIQISSKSDNKNVEIIVKDTGIGMPDYILKNLFSIDVRISREGTNKEKGTGLGMVLIKECIEKNNGSLQVYSKEEKGTEFKIYLELSKN